MRVLKTAPLFVATVWLSVTNIVCTDKGDPAGTQDTPVEASRTSVSMTPGSSTVVQVSGGTPPYYISAHPNPSVATAALGDSTVSPVTVTINSSGSSVPGNITAITVADADEAAGGRGYTKVAHGDNEVTIQVIITSMVGVSYSSDVQPIFDTRCATSGCHAGPTSPFGMTLEAGQSYSKIVGVAAQASDCNGDPRVDPGSASTSVLYKRIAGSDCGARMPWSLPPTVDSLTTVQQNTIRDWIDQGALNN